jgi:hypothetical protein
MDAILSLENVVKTYEKTRRCRWREFRRPQGQHIWLARTEWSRKKPP